MAYTEINFKTKKELKQAVAAKRAIAVFAPASAMSRETGEYFSKRHTIPSHTSGMLRAQ